MQWPDRIYLKLRLLRRRGQAWLWPVVIALAAALAVARLAGLAADGAIADTALLALIALGLWLEAARQRAARLAPTVPATAVAEARDREDLEDEIWRLRDTIERHRSLWTATGSILVRRGPPGVVRGADSAVPPELGLSAADILARFDAEPIVPRMHERELELETAIGPRRFLRNDVPGFSEQTNEPIIDIVLRDVTNQKQIETELARARDAAEAASAAKSRFLAATSHEIRTPLNGILGLAALLDETPLTPEQRSYLKGIRTSGTTLLALVSDVLDHARLVAGRDEPVTAPLDIRQLIEEVVELLAAPAHDKHIGIVADIAADLPRLVVGDAGRLRQIISNLAGNAVKFTAAGSVVVRARRRAEGEAHRLAIEVEDTGIGLSEADLERVFDEFEQVDQGPGRRHEGTGLGLPISRRLARSLGGDINVTSRLGQGACFVVDLPLVEVVVPQDVASDAADRLPPVARLDRQVFALVGAATPETAVLAAQIERRGGQVTNLAALSRLRAWIAENTPGSSAADAVGAVRSQGLTVILTDLAITTPAVVADLVRLDNRIKVMVTVAPVDRSVLPSLHEAGLAGYLVRPIRELSAVELLATHSGPRPATSTAAVRPDAPAAPPPATGLSILLVEDNPINLLLTRSLLERQGHRVVSVNDGLAAVDCVVAGRDARPFDLVLMDLHMPGCDGFTATETIRAAEDRLSRPLTRIWALTADASEMARTRAESVGIDRVFLKPVEPTAFAVALAGIAVPAEVAVAGNTGVESADIAPIGIKAADIEAPGFDTSRFEAPSIKPAQIEQAGIETAEAPAVNGVSTGSSEMPGLARSA